MLLLLLLVFLFSRDQRNTCNLYLKEYIRHVIFIGISIQQRPEQHLQPAGMGIWLDHKFQAWI